MSSLTARIGLIKPSTADAFSTADIANNWGKVDQYPGSFICTSTTRPAWGAAQIGMGIVESDTGLVWRWTGNAFIRNASRGLLTTTSGGSARGQRNTSISTTSYTTYVLAVSIDNVVVPDGRRTLMVTATWGLANCTTGLMDMGIFRSNVSNQSPTLATWGQAGDSTAPGAGGQGQGGSFVTYESGGLPAGVYSWSIQFKVDTAYRTTASSATVAATATTAIEIAVIEI